MFGLSFTEILVLCVVGIVVVGPKKLPTLMRTAGQWIAKLRGMSRDLRDQAGIDDLIRQEGLEKEIRELRSLSRTNVIDSLVNKASKPRPTPPKPKADEKADADSAKPDEKKAGKDEPSSAEAKPSVVGPEGTVAAPKPNRPRTVSGPPPAAVAAVAARLDPPRDREYPLLGCDHYDALPEDLDEEDEAEGEVDAGEEEGPAERASGDSEEAQP